MLYCLLGSSIKFQGHTGWKINDLNPIRVRLLGRSQLSKSLRFALFSYMYTYWINDFWFHDDQLGSIHELLHSIPPPLCRLFDTKPLSKPMLDYLQLAAFTTMYMTISTAEWRPFCPWEVTSRNDGIRRMFYIIFMFSITNKWRRI